MPVVAVAAAVYAGATIATVGIAAMSTMAVISAVGAIAAGVGVVTGDKTLTALGGVASLVGGIGSFAQSQGWLAGDLAGGEVASSAGDFARMDRAADVADAASNTSGMIAEAAPGIADPSAGLAGDTATGITDVGAPGGLADGAGAAGGSSGGTGLMNSQLSPLVAADVGAGAGVASVNAGTATSSSIFDSMKGIGEFMTKNKDLASLGMNFVGGMFDDKKKAETGQINATTGLYDAKTQSELLQQDILRQQTANANSVPDLTGLRVRQGQVYNTGPAPTHQAPRAGLINSTGR